MMFEVHYHQDTGHLRRTKASNGEILCHSESHGGKQPACVGMKAVRQIAPAAPMKAPGSYRISQPGTDRNPPGSALT